MDMVDLSTVGVCILWVAVCGLRWYVTDKRNRWQRRFFAMAAGLGAGMFWILGQNIWPILISMRKEPTEIKSGEEIRVHGR